MKKVTRISYRTIHTDYLQFAVTSSRTCSAPDSAPSNRIFVNRHAVDTVRYSYDCLDAAVEFIYFAGTNQQLPLTIPDNWLTRYLRRKWREMPLNDRLGCMCFAWTASSFWESDYQLQLFLDLKKLRDGLTHIRPLGTEHGFESSDPGSLRKRFSRLIDSSYLVCPKPVAQFNADPVSLDESDAKQALEILLLHLTRIQKVFQVMQTTLFAYYDEQLKTTSSTIDLLNGLPPKFSKYWQP